MLGQRTKRWRLKFQCTWQNPGRRGHDNPEKWCSVTPRMKREEESQWLGRLVLRNPLHQEMWVEEDEIVEEEITRLRRRLISMCRWWDVGGVRVRTSRVWWFDVMKWCEKLMSRSIRWWVGGVMWLNPAHLPHLPLISPSPSHRILKHFYLGVLVYRALNHLSTSRFTWVYRFTEHLYLKCLNIQDYASTPIFLHVFKCTGLLNTWILEDGAAPTPTQCYAGLGSLLWVSWLQNTQPRFCILDVQLGTVQSHYFTYILL